MTAILYNFQEERSKRKPLQFNEEVVYEDDPEAINETPWWVTELIEYYGGY